MGEKKKSPVQVINDMIVQELFEAKLSGDALVWQRPYFVYPKQNFSTKREYNAVNRLLLGDDGEEFYLTLTQVNEQKGNVKDFNWKYVFSNFKQERQVREDYVCQWFEEVYTRDGVRYASQWRNKYTKVLRLSDTDIVAPEKNVFQPRTDISEYIDGCKFNIKHQGSISKYDVETDTVVVPHRGRFDSEADYYNEIFKGIVTATAIPTRLNRVIFNKDNPISLKKQTIREELVVEMSSCACLLKFGMTPPIKNTAAAIDVWMDAIKEDETLFTVAAGRAEKVLKFLGV